ncbi:DUF4261 domain-containing protein [Rhizobium sp. NZLR1]|uniref:DUF4261 domain-containing protein n=1 Tax=Rhizobium sp. NZLR1 TaxID=2731096 RepID=UPI001A981488|nr:DUF4261 domain-containing protein [Rhizobium sp. NZLR1]MBX5202427.1 DUF4261 domain-containing protein [Rhizobium sp. NZLR1]QSZ20674.1 DUF4261 domain-containing protein [Rhizobium sp. NZLR1]
MIAIIFMKEGDPNCLSSISLALRQSWPDSNLEISDNTDSKPLFVFHDGVLGGSLMFMDVKAPLAETDPEIRNAWFWPSAWEEVSRHQAHMIVTIFGGNATQKAIGLQRMLRLILASVPSTIGVGYPSSGTLLPTSMVLSVLEKDTEVAVPLFVSCSFAKEEDARFSVPSIFCSTEGLGIFGLKEIEVRGYPGTVQSLHEFMFAFATYLIEYRPNIVDGDTVGSDQQKILVKIEKSLINRNQVYSLYFQQ